MIVPFFRATVSCRRRVVSRQSLSRNHFDSTDLSARKFFFRAEMSKVAPSW